MKVAVYSKVLAFQHREDIQFFFSVIEKHEFELHIYQPFYEQIKDFVSFSKHQIHLFTDEIGQFPIQMDVIISLGGDGTILDTAAYVKHCGAPVFGINFGRLGFLASIQKTEMEQAIEALMCEQYTLDERSLIQVDSETHMFGKNNFALNDIAIQKRDDASMMVIHAYLNNEFVCSYWANGLIVATPTGSTAYSLSCGGPVIYPSTSTLVMTPIAPHNLNVRPLIYPDEYILSLQIEGRSAKYLVSCDSKTEIVDNFAQLRITKANFNLNLLRLNNESYLTTLRNKLNWGIDSRN